MKLFKGVKFGKTKIDIFKKMRVRNLRGGGSVKSDLEKTRLLNLRNVEKPTHPQFSGQRAPEG